MTDYEDTDPFEESREGIQAILTQGTQELAKTRDEIKEITKNVDAKSTAEIADIIDQCREKLDAILKKHFITAMTQTSKMRFNPFAESEAEQEILDLGSFGYIRVSIENVLGIPLYSASLTAYTKEGKVHDEPNLKDLYGDDENDEESYDTMSSTSVDGELEDIASRIRSMELEMILREKIGKISDEDIQQWVPKYGAKAAHLIELQKRLEKINEILLGRSDAITIPPFQLISTETHRKWEQGKLIDGDLQKIYQKIRGKKIILRSSAVFSEDNENTSAAGLYDSITIEESASFEEFKTAVINVYKSVNSEKAIQYRDENGIEKEEMGIVVQEFHELGEDVTPLITKYHAYANTVLRNVPSLSEIVYVGASREILDREICDRIFTQDVLEHANGNEDHFPDGNNHMYHVQPDHSLIYEVVSKNTALTTWILEKIFGKPVNIELATSTLKKTIFQVRPLPKEALKEKKIDFPEKEHLSLMRALGIGDIEMDILPTMDESNHTKEGIVIFDSGFGGNALREKLTKQLPKSGAVILFGGSAQNRGHLETLCAEKGLLLLFHRSYRESGGRKQGRSITEFQGHKKLHIVANGLEGRIYPPKDYIAPPKPEPKPKKKRPIRDFFRNLIGK